MVQKLTPEEESDIQLNLNPPSDLETQKEEIKKYIKRKIEQWLSDDEIEKLVNPKDGRIHTAIKFLFNYRTADFQAMNITCHPYDNTMLEEKHPLSQ